MALFVTRLIGDATAVRAAAALAPSRFPAYKREEGQTPLRSAIMPIVELAFIALAITTPPSVTPSTNDPATTRYCLRVEAPTGSLIETVKCWTRAQWSEQGVDVDKEWPREGVAIRN